MTQHHQNRIVTALTVVIALSFGCAELLAQGRPVGRAAQVAAAVDAGKEVVLIRKLTGTGTDGRVKTPDYSVSSSESSRVQDWLRVTVAYETESEWIDELEFRYFVVVKHPKTAAFTMFTASVTYLDIAKGKNHVSDMFLRPNTLARYGDIERFAVEIYAKGELLASNALPNNPPNWWQGALNVRKVEGMLLNRAQTPFALIAYDNYETIKQR